MPLNTLPGVKVELIDGQLRPVSIPVLPKVTLIGTTNNPNVDPGEPIRVESDDDASVFDNYFDSDGTTPNPLGVLRKPSELTKAIAEVFAGGADNVEVVALPDPTGTQLKLEITPTAARRYDALDTMYGLLKFTEVDIITPVGATLDASGLASTQNFAWQLGNFCHQTTINERGCIGVIGVTAPVSTGIPTLAETEAWVAALETYDTSGILGADFTIGDGTTDGDTDGVPDNYAFWATSDEAIPSGLPAPRYDADVVEDRKGFPVDLGKYVSVVSEHCQFLNEESARVSPTTGLYSGSMASTYAGLISNLPARIGTTNQLIRGAIPLRKLAPSQVERLTSKRYVSGLQRPGVGYVVGQGITWAHRISDAYRSDFTQLTTVRITFDAIGFCRARAMRYIGQPNNAVTRAALRADIDEALGVMQKLGALQRYEFQLNVTPAQAVLGKMTIDLKLVPAYEILEITVTAALAAE